MRLFGIDNVTDSDDWYTPKWIFDGLALTFDLDVAAPDTGPLHVPTRRYFTVADDGLGQPWDGLVWCNPPYSAPIRWCTRYAEHTDGALILIRADLSTGGPFRAFTASDALYVPPKRLQFIHASGRSNGSVNFSTVLLGRSEIVKKAMHRLAAMHGGTTRTLTKDPDE